MPKKTSNVSLPRFSYNLGGGSQLPLVFYAILIIAIVGLGASLYAISSLNSIKKSLNPATINVNDLMAKVTGHIELSALKDTAPFNIVQINTNNLAVLQGQIQGLNINHLGKFLIQYPDRIVIYDYANDIVEGQIPLQQQPQLPGDFTAKLYAHDELSGLEGVIPVGGVLDEQSLATLKGQFPDVYKEGKVGDFLLRYPTSLVIYDYAQDKIVNKVELQQGQQ